MLARVPGAAADVVATRTGPSASTVSVSVPPSRAVTVPEKRLHWPMKSATKRDFGKR